MDEIRQPLRNSGRLTFECENDRGSRQAEAPVIVEAAPSVIIRKQIPVERGPYANFSVERQTGISIDLRLICLTLVANAEFRHRAAIVADSSRVAMESAE
jgi:hypothetical protein